MKIAILWQKLIFSIKNVIFCFDDVYSFIIVKIFYLTWNPYCFYKLIALDYYHFLVHIEYCQELSIINIRLLWEVQLEKFSWL